MPKSTHFTYLLNIDIDIAIFCKYRIDIASKLKTWYRSSTTTKSPWCGFCACVISV